MIECLMIECLRECRYPVRNEFTVSEVEENCAADDGHDEDNAGAHTVQKAWIAATARRATVAALQVLKALLLNERYAARWGGYGEEIVQ
eukprot:SAG11_NODE_1741_length_4336_cov_1.517583_4_plen_89_part_00